MRDSARVIAALEPSHRPTRAVRTKRVPQGPTKPDERISPVIAAQDLAGRLSFCVALCSAARLPLASGELAPAREVRDVLSAFGLTVIPLSPVLMIRSGS